MKKQCLSFLFLASLTLLKLVIADEGTCSEAFDKSAVTPDATKEAEKVKLNPPPAYSNEVYSSKVKS